MMNKFDLLSCPFCGGKATFEFKTFLDSSFDDDRYQECYIRCVVCGARGKSFICNIDDLGGTRVMANSSPGMEDTIRILGDIVKITSITKQEE